VSRETRGPVNRKLAAMGLRFSVALEILRTYLPPLRILYNGKFTDSRVINYHSRMQGPRVLDNEGVVRWCGDPVSEIKHAVFVALGTRLREVQMVIRCEAVR
jgi:hypothetical protein